MKFSRFWNFGGIWSHVFFLCFFHGFNEVCYIGIRFFSIENSVRDRVIPVNRECYKSRMDIFPAFNCDHEVLGLFTLVKYLNIVKLRSICNVNLWMLQNLGAVVVSKVAAEHKTYEQAMAGINETLKKMGLYYQDFCRVFCILNFQLKIYIWI